MLFLTLSEESSRVYYGRSIQGCWRSTVPKALVFDINSEENAARRKANVNSASSIINPSQVTIKVRITFCAEYKYCADEGFQNSFER